MLTLEGTGQQARVDLVELLLDNGWQFDIAWQDPDARGYEPGMWLSEDGAPPPCEPRGARSDGDVRSARRQGGPAVLGIAVSVVHSITAAIPPTRLTSRGSR
jgi:hypothetical protein